MALAATALAMTAPVGLRRRSENQTVHTPEGKKAVENRRAARAERVGKPAIDAPIKSRTHFTAALLAEADMSSGRRKDTNRLNRSSVPLDE
jgi:hypothetical protein